MRVFSIVFYSVYTIHYGILRFYYNACLLWTKFLCKLFWFFNHVYLYCLWRGTGVQTPDRYAAGPGASAARRGEGPGCGPVRASKGAQHPKSLKGLSTPKRVKRRITKLALMLGLKGRRPSIWRDKRIRASGLDKSVLLGELFFLEMIQGACKLAPYGGLGKGASRKREAQGLDVLGRICNAARVISAGSQVSLAHLCKAAIACGEVADGDGRGEKPDSVRSTEGVALEGDGKGYTINYIDSNSGSKNLLMRMQLDAEWFNEQDGVRVSVNRFVTLQAALMGKLRWRKVIFEHPDLRETLPKEKFEGFEPSPEVRKFKGASREAQGPSTQIGGIESVLEALLPFGGPYTITPLPEEAEEGGLRSYPEAQGGDYSGGVATPQARRCAQAQDDSVLSTELSTEGGGEPHPSEGESEAQANTSAKPKHFWDLEINCFYSYSDIVALLGRDMAVKVAEHLTPGKRLRLKTPGKFLKLPLVIKDRFGVSRQLRVGIVDWYGLDHTSLVNTCRAYNVEIPHKDLMTDYKTMMDKAYLDPETHSKMISYALSDLCLADLYDAYHDNYKWLCSLVNVEDDSYPPMTKGAKVARMFLRHLESIFPVSQDFPFIADVPCGKGKRGKGKPSIRHLLRLYGCKELLESDPRLTKRHLAIVLGGRIQHEIPGLSALHHIITLSMDLQSCYGTALKHLSFPIGHPMLFYYPKHKPAEWPTMGRWLHKWELELVDNCWYAIIDTTNTRLSFSQNLMFSKYIDRGDTPHFNEEAKDTDEFKTDDGHIRGTFCLLEREIKNGVLTSSNLSILKKCCSNQEWGELKKKVRIKAAMIYPRSKMIEYRDHMTNKTHAEWEAELRSRALANEKRVTTLCNIEGHIVEDRRPGPWVRLPLSHFIEPLVSVRTALKREMKGLSGGEYQKKNAEQTSIKGVVNTLYGIMASPYFDTSCPCVANNITAMARDACWMMSTASGGFKSITDGCELDLNKVRFWVGKGPSMNTMALLGRRHLLPRQTRDRIIEAPLGSGGDPNIRWDLLTKESGERFLRFKGVEYHIEEARTLIESMYKEHVFHFFRHSGPFNDKGLEWALRFGIECKIIGVGYASHGLADYQIGGIYFNDPDIIKARGHKLNEPHYRRGCGTPVESPMKTLLNDLYKGAMPQVPIAAIYFKPCSVGEYKIRRQPSKGTPFLPGDSIPKSVHPKLINVSEFTFPTIESRLEWAGHYKYTSRRYELGLEAPYLDLHRQLKDLSAVKLNIQYRITHGKPPKRIPSLKSLQALARQCEAGASASYCAGKNESSR